MAKKSIIYVPYLDCIDLKNTSQQKTLGIFNELFKFQVEDTNKSSSSWSSVNAFVFGAAVQISVWSSRTVLPGRNDADMRPANSLHASASYSEYNQRFD